MFLIGSSIIYRYIIVYSIEYTIVVYIPLYRVIYYNTGYPYSIMGTEYGHPRYLLYKKIKYNLKSQ